MTRTIFLVLFLLLAGCGRDFSNTNPIYYATDVRPVPPFTTWIAPTGSMEPEIHSGALILVTYVDIKDVRPGDNIAFWWAARKIPVVHKVMRTFVAANGEIGLITKGTHNQFSDVSASGLEHVTTKEDLIGSVTVLRN